MLPVRTYNHTNLRILNINYNTQESAHFTTNHPLCQARHVPLIFKIERQESCCSYSIYTDADNIIFL